MTLGLCFLLLSPYCRQSEETRRKISETMKAKWADKDYREAQMQAFAASDRSEKISETRRHCGGASP